MKKAIKIFRAFLIAILFIAVGLPAICYVMLSTDWAQTRMRDAGQEALTRLLGSEVSIEKTEFSPFNRLLIKGVSVCDDNGKKALGIEEAKMRVELFHFLRTGVLVVDYVVIDGLDLSLYKADASAPLNIDGIISRFKKNEEERPKRNLRVKLNDLEIMKSRFSYNVLDAPFTPGVFNPNHIELDSLNVRVFAPIIGSDDFSVRLRHLNFVEQSGFKVVDWESGLRLTDSQVQLTDFSLKLPNSTLYLADIDLPLDGIASLERLGTEIPVEVGINEGSHLYIPDLQYFVQQFKQLPYDMYIEMQASGKLDSLHLQKLDIEDKSGYLSLSAQGYVFGLPKPENIVVKDFEYSAHASAYASARAISLYGSKMSAQIKNIITNAGNVNLNGKISGDIKGFIGKAVVASGVGKLDFVGKLKQQGRKMIVDATIETDNFDLGHLLGNSDLGRISSTIKADGTIHGKQFVGVADADVKRFGFKGYDYESVIANIDLSDSLYSIVVNSKDPNARMSVNAKLAKSSTGYKWAAVRGDFAHINLDTLNLYKNFPGHWLSAQLNCYAEGYSFRDFDGTLNVNNIRYVNAKDEGLKLKKLVVDADNSPEFGTISIASDILNGQLEGRYDLSCIAPTVKNLIYEVFPNLLRTGVNTAVYDPTKYLDHNEFTYEFVIDKAEPVCKFFNFPVSILDPVTISGELSESRHFARINFDADWLLQGDKLIEDTYLSAFLDGKNGEADVYLTTHYPTKKGPMNLVAKIDGQDGLFNSKIDWEIERDIPIFGTIAFDTFLDRNIDHELTTTVAFKPGQINFGNEVWEIKPSEIVYADKLVSVSNFSLIAPTQSISINGTASPYEADILAIDLKNINLIEIFETLEIDKALICGDASGKIYASRLFTKEPIIKSEGFKVKDIGYNGCVIGDADLELGFDTEKEAFYFDADVVNDLGKTSHINGTITPATEELDFYFDADHVKVGFLKPFMEAFCSDIEGYATGKAHLYGNFKYIDMSGDIMADTVRLKIDFTNTWYSASTPLHIEPGLINLDNITIYDIYGNTALLNGVVRHKFFKEPSFDFGITNAVNFLSYDISRADNPRWYGRIFGNGSAYVKGEPGIVNINVNMSTAPHSTFTFELLDSEIAEEYSFIVFNDATPQPTINDFTDIKIESKAEEKAKSMKQGEEGDVPTAFNIDIAVDINTDAQVNIVMDPIGGDCIRAHGQGMLRLTYGSVNDDLRMHGNYTLDRGDYNFTLQNIIIKDFKIRQGSSISFKGDPYTAVLDIDAIYSTNANLSDLDESFLQDKDLNRTNVPVYAVLKVTGNMQQPDISFDLEFPTLTQDTYRKVRSIVSTDDMMNRQIIYLLALNRFYTPEYMASTTKGNELFSVASSTISSQLSSMLGKLSDNWSIAPNLRSDRGDFSDVEVDVALSSSLLNNRLLFNGNFGYRDKTLNTNQFVGDFDIEYLLDRSGIWRLKAYNRYNDQNYYLRTAQTTQGVGVMVRRDFDNLFNFLKKKKEATADTVPPIEIFQEKVEIDSISE